jgi:hypothetical protein
MRQVNTFAWKKAEKLVDEWRWTLAESIPEYRIMELKQKVCEAINEIVDMVAGDAEFVENIEVYRAKLKKFEGK